MLYHFHIAASRDEPMPPVLTMIEADDPEQALASLKRELVAVRGGRLSSVWPKAVVSYWPNGEPRHVLSTEVPVVPVAGLN